MRSHQQPLWAGLATVAAAAALALAPIAPATATTTPTTSTQTASNHTQCSALPVTHSLHRSLIGAFRRAAELPHSVRLKITGTVRSGECSSTHWAWAVVEPAPHQHLSYREQVSLQDHSVLYKRRPGHHWVNLGDGPICGAHRLPAAMAQAWNVPCS